jgi:hypothetical protein
MCRPGSKAGTQGRPLVQLFRWLTMRSLPVSPYRQWDRVSVASNHSKPLLCLVEHFRTYRVGQERYIYKVRGAGRLMARGTAMNVVGVPLEAWSIRASPRPVATSQAKCCIERFFKNKSPPRARPSTRRPPRWFDRAADAHPPPEAGPS